ncbi:lipopolysaccharide heptosyltransferase-1 [Salmonella sp. NCTC 11881]|nr:lipopolysaccharide heptosyltransferase-1 [Salmonella sp. NCTC 11881]
MRVLIVKTSSMGDVLHTLPALTDAQQAIPGIQFDWAVEEGFAQIPSWQQCCRSRDSRRYSPLAQGLVFRAHQSGTHSLSSGGMRKTNTTL